MSDHSLLMFMIAVLASGGVVYILGFESRERELRTLLKLHGSKVRVLLIGRSMTSLEIASTLSVDHREVIDVLKCLELQGTVKESGGLYTFNLSG